MGILKRAPAIPVESEKAPASLLCVEADISSSGQTTAVDGACWHWVRRKDGTGGGLGKINRTAGNE